ncbi:MAG: hypothetical protein LBQ75_04125, partial [Zoogloeaceae bacterium]|nr:hypothetical protein [Zoogloeaceae bacterium]
MKPQAVLSCLALFPGRAIFWLIAALFSNLVPAQFNIAQQPLTAEKPMDPNVVYIHDDYPSMNNTYMPDETPQGEAYDYYGVAQVGHLRAAPFLNVIFYNPDVTYQPPVRHDGTRLTHLRNSDKLSSWPEVCQDGYAKQVQEGGTCANKTRLIANSANRETGGAIPITGTGAAAAAYWDYVPAYNSMRDNPNFNPKVKPEDDMYNYEYWAFRPAKPGYFFRTNDKLAQTYYRSATGNGTLVGNRACPTIFREVTDSKEYYGGLESSSGAYSGRLQNPVPQLPEQSWRGGVVHAHCRTGYRLWDVHEEGVGHGYLSTSYFEHGGTMPFNLVRPRSRWCMDATRYDGVSGGVLRPWEPYPWVGKPDWPSTGERITCYAGRHAIGDTTGKGYWDKNKDAANAPVSHFEYKGQIFNSPGTCANGICNNLNGAEQSRPHLVNQFVNDNGELVTEKTPRRRTSQEEIRNFMNWYTYYRTRNMAAKAGMSIAFSQFVDWKNPGKPGEAMQGRHIRLGYDTTSSGSMSPRASAGRGPGQMDSSRNGIGVVPFRDFPADATEPDGTKSPYAGQQFVRRFYDWLLAVSPQPSAEEKDHQLHMALNNTGNYFRTQAPWKEYPPTRYIKGGEGGTGKVFGCRRSFSILMTDGNAKIRAVDLAPFNAINGGDVDGATLPRVIKQDSNGNPVRSYQYRPRAPFFGQHKNYAVKGSLADIAMYYWGVDLLPNVPNQVAPTKRNPAFWQHMQTFTIGLGVQGSLSDIDVNNFLANSNPTRNILWTYPGGLNEQYEQNDDLMHAGLNGHGGTMAATAAEELAGRISALITEAEGDPTSKSVYAGSGGKALGGNDLSYRTEYDPAEWTGGLYAHRLCVPEFYGRKLLWGVEICKKGKEG